MSKRGKYKKICLLKISQKNWLDIEIWTAHSKESWMLKIDCILRSLSRLRYQNKNLREFYKFEMRESKENNRGWLKMFENV